MEEGSGPTYSVIVAAYDSEDRVGATMRSVLAQTRDDLELIVVDDGSTDATATRAEAVAAGDDRVRVVRQPNSGTVGARNRGLELARGRYVGFLDDDDLWLPRFLEAVGGRLEADRAAGLAFADAHVVDAASGLVGSRSALERFPRSIRSLGAVIAPAQAEEALLRVNFITTCAALISRRAIERVGPLDPAITGADDWDLWLRIAAVGFPVLRVAEPLAALRKRADSVSADELLMARNARLALERARERGLSSSRAERIADRHLRVIAAEIAAAEAGSSPRLALARIARRLGRKRPPLGQDRGREATGELRETLALTRSGTGRSSG